LCWPEEPMSDMTPTPPETEIEELTQRLIDEGCQGEDEQGCTRDDALIPRDQWCVNCLAGVALSALTTERLARQQAENDATGWRDDLAILKVKHAAEVLARQQAERELSERIAAKDRAFKEFGHTAERLDGKCQCPYCLGDAEALAEMSAEYELRLHSAQNDAQENWQSVKRLTAQLTLSEQARAQAEQITADTSDGYHTFRELYEYRKAYNALLFNQWAALGLYDVHKSWLHSDGGPCFGGGWFIVVAQMPTGQISNHYKADDWPLFAVPERERGAEWDGHTPQIALERLLALAALTVPQETTTDVTP